MTENLEWDSQSLIVSNLGSFEKRCFYYIVFITFYYVDNRDVSITGFWKGFVSCFLSRLPASFAVLSLPRWWRSIVQKLHEIAFIRVKIWLFVTAVSNMWEDSSGKKFAKSRDLSTAVAMASWILASWRSLPSVDASKHSKHRSVSSQMMTTLCTGLIKPPLSLNLGNCLQLHVCPILRLHNKCDNAIAFLSSWLHILKYRIWIPF